jgi:hypothetical protein
MQRDEPSPPQHTRKDSMGLKIGRALAGPVVFVLLVMIGITAGVFLECVDAIAVILAPMFTRRR